MSRGNIDRKNIGEILGRLVDQVRLLIIATDAGGNILFVNKHLCEAVGYAESELLGKSLFETIIPVSKIAPVSQSIKAVIENNITMQSEHPFLKKDGVQRVIQWQNSPIIENGTPTGVLSIGIDITSHTEVEFLLSLNEKTMRDRAKLYEEQNKALEKTKLAMLNLLDDERILQEELQKEKRSVEDKVVERTNELNEEKARLLAAINSFPYGFIVTDDKGEVVLFNERLNGIFNLRRVGWTLTDLGDLLGENANFKGNFNEVTRTKVPKFLNDIDLQRKFLTVYIAPIFINQLSNTTIGTTILVNDVTEQKIIERSKDEFFSIASHELRTPLTAIRGNTELIQKRYLEKINDPSFSEIIGDVRESAERLISLVNEFLNMSRLEQGKMQFELERINVFNIAEEVVRELDAHAKSKEIKVTLECATPDKMVAFADKNRTREILTNLVGNAINYNNPHGSVLVDLEANGGFVKTSVTDTGKGISTQNQNLLFRKFQQANQNIYTRDASRSSGLGLYISKLMVEAMKGSIYLEKSELGVGSVFVFALPIA